jgi:phosphoribosylformylglycinamidine (FGAM) synthase PurS component
MTNLLLAASLFAILPEPTRPVFDPASTVARVRAACHGRQTPATLDETGFLLDTNFLRTRCAWMQSYASTASSGETLLVVWEDHRGYFQDDIYACRITGEGTLLDSSGILVSAEPWNQQRPAVVFDGRNFLIAWQDGRSGEIDIYAARVSMSGELLDPHGFAVSTAAGGEGYPSVAALDTFSLVVWQDARSGSSYDVYAARVTRAGLVLDPAGVPVSTGTANEQYPALSGSGDGWLAVWQDYRNGGSDIYCARITPAGNVLDTAGLAVASLSGDQNYPAAAFDSIWLVAWADQRSGDGDIYAARLNSDGDVLDSAGFVVSAAARQQTSPAVCATAGRFFVAWDDARSYPDYEVYASRVTRSGAVLEPTGICLSRMEGTQSGPALAPCAGGWLAAWHDSRGGQTWSVFGTRVSAAGAVVDSAGILLAPAAYGQYDTDVAFDGDNYLVVWSDFRRGSSKDIYACRVTPRGQVLDPQGIAVCTLDNWQGIPVIAWGDSAWLVAWGDLRTGDFDIYGSRVGPGGEVLDPDGIPICRRSQVQTFPDVAWNGSNWLLAWHDFRRYQYDIYGARVGKDGVVLDTGIAICLAGQGQYYPAIAGSDTAALVVWNDSRSGSYILYGARVTQSGQVLDPNGLALSSRTSMNGDVAFDGTNFFVTWDDSRNGYSDIFGARVSPDGVVLDPNGRSVGAGVYYQSGSAVAWTGDRYAVAWQDWRNGHDYDIFGCYVLPDGTARPSFPVHTGDNEQITPAACAGPDAQAFFVYCGWVEMLGGRSANTYRIWARFDPQQAIEEHPTPGVSAATPPATIERGVLRLPPSPFSTHYSLFSLTGRRVMSLVPGPNDVRHLAPGVYFIRDWSDGPCRSCRVVITR